MEMRKYLTMALLLGLATTHAPAKSEANDVPPVAPIPTAKQVAWQQLETYAFIHFGLNTFNDKEWGYGNSDVKTFNPAKLDCEQWARTFVEAGMKGVIITAKHHDGFCLWPTHTTDYCIRNTPYKNGEGDIIGELSKACKKYGLKFGVYLSPWDRNQASYGSPFYVKYYQRQLKELLSNYGEMFEIWFDGANGGDGWYGGAEEKRTIDRRTYYNFPRIHEIVDSLQPNAAQCSEVQRWRSRLPMGGQRERICRRNLLVDDSLEYRLPRLSRQQEATIRMGRGRPVDACRV